MTNRLRLKIASASCNQTAGDWPRNLANICKAIDIAVADGADILSLEELGLSGYERGDDFLYSDNRKTHELLTLIARYAAARDPNLVISVGHPWHYADKQIPSGDARRNNPLFNRLDLPFDAQSFITGGKILAMSAKRYLYNYGRGYEKRHFSEWSDEAANRRGGRKGAITIKLPGGARIPFGSPVVRVGKGRAAITLHHVICEEYWVGSRFDYAPHDRDYARDNPLAQKAKDFDITVVLSPSASPPSEGKIDNHYWLCRLASQYCGVFVHTDGLGSSGSTFAQFGSRLMAQNGKIISEGRRASFRDVAYTSQIVTVRPARAKGRPHAAAPHVFRDRHAPAVQDGPAPWEKTRRRAFEEELRNECLWLFDYMRKNKIQGIAQALSGGADSAYNAAKVRLMAELAWQELGAKGFFAAMPHLSCKQDVLALHKRKGDRPALNLLMQHLLTCVYMSTRNSSAETLNAARALVEGGKGFDGIGGVFHHLDMQPLFEKSLAAYEGDVEGVAYENIQARLRQTLIMLFANTEGKIAISNPNLDEARNSYATWGGDLHAGMISGNAHKDKARELAHMRLLYERGLDGLAPVKAFHLVLKNKPTAELQPKSKDGKVTQFDEDALGRTFDQMRVISLYMLYDRAFPERKNNPVEVFAKCRRHAAFKTDSIETLHDRILLSYRKWAHAQFKIHGSPIAATYGENVDHQTSLRTPNTSSGHAPELAQMTLHCLSLMARRDRTTFKKLTGGHDLESLQSRALIDSAFAARLAEKMRDPSAKHGLPEKIFLLYKDIRKNGFESLIAPTPAAEIIATARKRRR